MRLKHYITPFSLPVLAFAAAILAGAVLLWLTPAASGGEVAFVDALFTATSSVCVTGLSTVDVSSAFSSLGHMIMLVLIQLGGLGIVTYSALLMYTWSRRVSLLDRVAVGQALLYDSSFHLGKFLQRIILVVFSIEALGALFLYLLHSESISPFNALFLAVSSFCNAGFALWPDNLIRFADSWSVCLVIMALIVLGGLGFFVLDEVLRLLVARVKKREPRPYYYQMKFPRQKPRLSFQSKLILNTSLFLILGGALLLWLTALANPEMSGISWSRLVLPSLFQSVSCRTAGFNTTSIAAYSDLALFIMIFLMVIGGSPGSAAGGMKTTTFRTLISYMRSRILGRQQVVVNGRALEKRTVNKALQLFFFSVLTITGATLALTVTENGALSHGATAFDFLELLYEVVSAYGTVGFTVNVTPHLSLAGKLIICVVMFIGRLGPIWLITTIQQLQTEKKYQLPEADIPIG